jgi:FAD binding domain/Berberine and berberine like
LKQKNKTIILIALFYTTFHRFKKKNWALSRLDLGMNLKFLAFAFAIAALLHVVDGASGVRKLSKSDDATSSKLFKVLEDLSPRLLAAMRASSGGNSSQLLWPWSESYKSATLMSNPRTQVYPLLVVRPASTEAVSAAMKLLYEHREFLGSGNTRVLGGKHSFESYSSVQNGVVLDTSLLNSIQVVPDDKEEPLFVEIGAGVRLLDVYRGVNESVGPSYLVVGGFCPTVGVAGFAMGGGYSPWLSRALGLAADNTMSFRVVLADGTVVDASAEAKDSLARDLYWALRGAGGGNFGVVTEMRQRLHNLDALSGGTVADGRLPWLAMTWMLDSVNVSTVIRAFADFTGRESTQALLPLGANLVTDALRGTATVRAIYLGSEAELNASLAPLIASLPPTDLVKRGTDTFLTLDSIYGAHFRPFEWPGRTHVTSSLIVNITDAVVDASLDALNLDVANDLLVSVDFLFVSRMSKTGQTTGSYAHPEANYNIAVGWQWPEARRDNAYMLLGEDIVQQFAVTDQMVGSYVNYIDGLLPNWAEYYYGASLPRLQSIKRQVDPSNFFSFPQGIDQTLL